MSSFDADVWKLHRSLSKLPPIARGARLAPAPPPRSKNPKVNLNQIQDEEPHPPPPPLLQWAANGSRSENQNRASARNWSSSPQRDRPASDDEICIEVWLSLCGHAPLTTPQRPNPNSKWGPGFARCHCVPLQTTRRRFHLTKTTSCCVRLVWRCEAPEEQATLTTLAGAVPRHGLTTQALNEPHRSFPRHPTQLPECGRAPAAITCYILHA